MAPIASACEARRAALAYAQALCRRASEKSAKIAGPCRKPNKRGNARPPPAIISISQWPEAHRSPMTYAPKSSCQTRQRESIASANSNLA